MSSFLCFSAFLSNLTLFCSDLLIMFLVFQALGYALIAEPEYMLKEDIGKILEGSLASDVDPRIKVPKMFIYWPCSFI